MSDATHGNGGMQDGRFAHEETANDRWVGAMLEVGRIDTPGRVDALVDRSVDAVRADRRAARRAGRRAGRRDWRTPLVAAASIALVAGAALLFSPQPASASALLRQAQAAEAGAGDRRYLIDMPWHGPPGPGGQPRARATLDVRDPTHVRLEVLLPDGRTMVRALDGARAWTITPDGEVLRVPSDAPWPRLLETPEGDLMVDRLDTLLADVGAFYSIDRCDADGEMRLCAVRVDPSFRGPQRINLTLDPATKSVRRAELSLPPARGPRGEGLRGDGHRSDGLRGDGPRGHGPRGERARGDGARGGDPGMVVFERVSPPEGGFAQGWFTPPSEPTRDAPPERDGRRPPHPPRR
jgi:hypothetical protein